MSQFTGLKQPIPQTIRVIFNLSANTPAGTPVLGKIVTDPALPQQDFLVVPSNEIWHITDIFAEASADIGVDGYVDLMINELRQNLRFGPLAQTLRTLLNPIKLKTAIVIDKLSKVYFVFTNRTAVGGTSTTTTITVEVVRIPVA